MGKAERIALTLRQRIREGVYADGQRIPSERELAKQYDVSRETVKRALNTLTQEGLLSAARGSVGRTVRVYTPIEWWPGTFESSSTRRDTTEHSHDAWAGEVRAQNRTPSQRIDVAVVAPPPLVAQRLHTPEEEMVVRRQRLRFVDNTPYQIADSYYPQHIAQGTLIMEEGDLTVPGGLMAHAGYRQHRFLDEITVRMPTVEEKERLQLQPGTPVAEHIRTGYDSHNDPVRVIITIAPGDRHKIMYEVSDR